jgi:type II secretory pathway pseudopilin PulG
MSFTKQKPIWYVIGCIGLALFGGVPCIGVGAAIAIPSFVSYTRRAKTAEARANLMALASGVRAACEAPGGALPDALGPTLASPSSERQVPTLDPRWSALGLAADPSYYAYSIERPDATTAMIVAVGDLDGDGERSRFARTCTASAGACTCGEIEVTNELE